MVFPYPSPKSPAMCSVPVHFQCHCHPNAPVIRHPSPVDLVASFPTTIILLHLNAPINHPECPSSALPFPGDNQTPKVRGNCHRQERKWKWKSSLAKPMCTIRKPVPCCRKRRINKEEISKRKRLPKRKVLAAEGRSNQCRPSSLCLRNVRILAISRKHHGRPSRRIRWP